MNEGLQPKIFIVVLNFNGNDTLNACLSSIFKSDYPNFEIVVVDNDSKDDSFEKARVLFPRVNFIKNPSNFGFSKGNNIGIRWALEKFADYVFILNNDTTIEKTALSSLVQAMKKYPSAGIASPIILASDNTNVWFAGGLIHWRKMKTEHLYSIKSEMPYSTDYISGCAMFASKEVFKKIGLFDERFFLYYEDADFSLRAKKAGFNLLMVPSAHISHLEQSNVLNKSKIYWLVLSGLMFFRTHSSFLNKLWIIFIYLPLRKIKNLYALFFKKDLVAHDVRKAYKDFKKFFKS